MRARVSRIWAAWLLPWFVLRMFIPAGFMLAWSGDTWQIVLCSGTGPAVSISLHHEDHEHQRHDPHAAHAQHAHHAEHAAHHGHEQHGSTSHETSFCPFAVASAGALLASAPELVFAELASELMPLVSDAAVASTAVLVERIRGPPRV